MTRGSQAALDLGRYLSNFELSQEQRKGLMADHDRILMEASGPYRKRSGPGMLAQKSSLPNTTGTVDSPYQQALDVTTQDHLVARRSQRIADRARELEMLAKERILAVGPPVPDARVIKDWKRPSRDKPKPRESAYRVDKTSQAKGNHTVSMHRSKGKGGKGDMRRPRGRPRKSSSLAPRPKRAVRKPKERRTVYKRSSQIPDRMLRKSSTLGTGASNRPNSIILGMEAFVQNRESLTDESSGCAAL